MAATNGREIVLRARGSEPIAALRTQWGACCEAGNAWLAEVLKLGGMLVAIKKSVGHGKFGKLFTGDDALPFSQLWANRVMACVANKALSDDSSSTKNLPHNVETLHSLAQVPAAKLTKMIEQGEVSAKTTRAEAAAIVRRVKGKAVDEIDNYQEPVMKAEIRLDRFHKWVRAFVAKNKRLRNRIEQKLKDIVKELANG